MGKCNSKSKNKPVNVEQLFSSTKKNEKIKSEFYFFVQWILSFEFYKRLQNNRKKTSVDLSIKEDPKKSTIFKIIKAIDSLNEKDKFSVFSLYHNKKLQGKGYVNIEKETLKLFFVHLARNDVNKLLNILINGPPNNIRWLIWIAIAKVEYEVIETQLNLTNEETYKIMMNRQILDTIRITILKDIARTNTSNFFLNNFNWQSSLTNVLNSIASYDNKLGYCLGMNSIAANLLLVSDFNEEETFLLLRYLYSSEYGLKLREFFIEDFPRIKYYSFIINRLTEIRLPLIYDIIKKTKLEKTMWIDKWLQTLFGFLKLSLSVRLLDCIMALGFNFVIKFALGCLKYCEYDIINNDQISSENFNDILISKINGEIVIKYALSFRIGKETKMKYDQMFFEEIIRNEINEDDINDSFKHSNEVKVNNKNNRTINKENIDEDDNIKKEQSNKSNISKDKEIEKGENNSIKEIILIENEEKKKDIKKNNSSEIQGNKDDLQKLQIRKIKLIYNQCFKKEEEESKIKPLNSDYEMKYKAIKQMKAIYFGETTINEEPNEDETKMLCSLTNIPYEQFLKQFENDIAQKKKRKKSSSSIVNKKYTNGSHNSIYKFKSSGKKYSHHHYSIKNDSIISEDKKEYSSSFFLSDDNENFYSMSKGKLSDICMSNNKGSSLSLKCNEDNPIDENEEEEKTIIYGEEIEPILQENIPTKLVKLII